jgi:hypothetical protein
MVVLRRVGWISERVQVFQMQMDRCDQNGVLSEWLLLAGRGEWGALFLLLSFCDFRAVDIAYKCFGCYDECYTNSSKMQKKSKRTNDSETAHCIYLCSHLRTTSCPFILYVDASPSTTHSSSFRHYLSYAGNLIPVLSIYMYAN